MQTVAIPVEQLHAWAQALAGYDRSDASDTVAAREEIEAICADPPAAFTRAELNAEYTRGRREGWNAAIVEPGDGLAFIHAERFRQRTEEGFDAARDDAYTRDELPRAAACYALADWAEGELVPLDGFWPWSGEWWKPSGTIRNLAKAGALIASEIDRLVRAGHKS